MPKDDDFKAKLRALLEDDDAGKKKSRDDEDDMIVIRGKAARKFLGIEDDDKPAGGKTDDDGEDGGKTDETPKRGKTYFKDEGAK